MDNSPDVGNRICRSDCTGPESMWPFLSGHTEGYRVTGRKEGLLQGFSDLLCFSGRSLQALLPHTFIFGELLFPVEHTRPLICQLHFFLVCLNALHIDFVTDLNFPSKNSIRVGNTFYSHTSTNMPFIYKTLWRTSQMKWCELCLKNLIVH